MAKNKLTALQVKSAEDGKLFDGDGLSFVKKKGKGFWVYRYSHLGRRREMGLGSYPAISLADARKTRDRWSGILAAGQDPIAVRDAERDDELAQRQKRDPTFEEITMIVFEAKKASLRGEGKRGRWLSPLEHHVFPKIGRMKMTALHQTDISRAIAPIWKTKHPTAIKCMNRIGVVFKAARLMGIDCDPFKVEAAKHMLGAYHHEVQHIEATPWREIPALYARLDGGTASYLCLRWMMLTLVRSDGCRNARFGEIDEEAAMWTVPADRIKGIKGKVSDFRVPLSDEALRVAELCGELSGDFLFPSERGHGGLSDVGIQKTLNRLGEQGRPHGFRTSFRTWVQETDACSFEVAETILGHSIGNKVERSYARSDLLDQRRVALNKWAAYVTGKEAVIVQLHRDHNKTGQNPT